MMISPGAGLIGLVWAIAGYAIIFGILMLILAIRAGNLVNRSGGSQIYPS